MDKKLHTILSMTLGLVGMVLWLIPMLGIIVCLIGLFIGATAINSSSKNIAVSAIIINAVGLILTILRSGLVAYLT